MENALRFAVIACASCLVACNGGRRGTTPDASADGHVSSDARVDDAPRTDAPAPDLGTDAPVVPPDLGSAPCTNDGDCIDSLFCNGAEACSPGAPTADTRGCVAGASPCLAGQTCDEGAGRCVTTCGVAMDADGDSHVATECGGDDCDDTRADIHPGAVEACDGWDDDCNGLFDGPGEDADGDGHTSRLCAGVRGDDCDDHVPTTYVGAPELCNGVDDDCSRGGGAEPADDADGDGYAPISGACTGGTLPKTDCDDTLGFVHPGASETCDSFDDDCDGAIDEGTDAMCAAPHSTSACVAGGCRILSCDTGFADCSVLDAGCEAELAVDEANCGACGVTCFDGATCGSGTCAPRYAWDVVARGGGTDDVVDLATDASGNLYAAISGGSGLDFGGGALTLPSYGGGAIASFTSAGAHRFSHAIPTTGEQMFARAIAVDGSGNVYVVGQTLGDVTFAGVTHTGAGLQDAFVVSYDSSGAERWALLLGGTMGDDARDVAVDAAGNVYVVGSVQGTVDFGGGARAGSGREDLFVASFTSSGAHRWSSVFGSALDDVGQRVAAGATGVYVGGVVGGAVDFGGGAVPFAGSEDAALVRFGLDGTFAWSHAWGGPDWENVAAILVASGESVVFAGDCFERIDVGGGLLASGATGYVASYDVTGAHLWSIPILSGATVDEALAPAAGGGILVTASTTGLTTIGTGRRVTWRDQIARLTSTGGPDLAIGIGATGATTSISSLAGTSPGRVFVGGTLRNSMDFGGGVRSSDAAGDAAIVAIDF